MLATNTDVQDKLRAELSSAREFPGQDIPYEKLMGLPYLGAVCRETLRLCVFKFGVVATNLIVVLRYMPVNGITREYVATDARSTQQS